MPDTPSRRRWALLCWVLIAVATMSPGNIRAEGGPRRSNTSSRWAAMPASSRGELTIDGHKLICGKRPTVLDSKLDDYGAAFPGIPHPQPEAAGQDQVAAREAVDPRPRVRPPVSRTRRGDGRLLCRAAGTATRRLTPQGLEDVCTFMAPAKADNVHFTGTQRCEAMKACYVDKSIR